MTLNWGAWQETLGMAVTDSGDQGLQMAFCLHAIKKYNLTGPGMGLEKQKSLGWGGGSRSESGLA